MDAARFHEATDNFASTWPACIATKAAELQGIDIGRRYLRALREAWCIEGRGIHRRTVQADVARSVGLDLDAFSNALDDGSAEQAFRKDREECERLEIKIGRASCRERV